MKTNSNRARTAILYLFCVCRLAMAETEESVGYVRIVNGVSAGRGNVIVRVDGAEIYPKGYRFGAVTGGIGLTPGTHKLEMRREGVRTGTTDVTVEKNVTVTVIARAEEIAALDGKPARHQLKMMPLKPRDVAKGKVATFVSVSSCPVLRVDMRGADGKWQSVEVARLATAELPLRVARGYVALRSGGKPLDAIPVAESGNYVVVLFDDAAGRLHTVNFRDSGSVPGD